MTTCARSRPQEGVELDPAAARLIARAAQGSVRDGLSLLDQCFATGDRPVTLETCRRALGLAHPDVIRALLEGLAVRDAAAALRAAGAAFDAGADPRQLLRECSRLARAAELVAVGFAEGVRLEADEDELCRRLAAQEPDGFWLRVLEEMGAAELELRQPVDARLQVEACLLRLCRGGSAGGGDGAPRRARGSGSASWRGGLRRRPRTTAARPASGPHRVEPPAGGPCRRPATRGATAERSHPGPAVTRRRRRRPEATSLAAADVPAPPLPPRWSPSRGRAPARIRTTRACRTRVPPPRREWRPLVVAGGVAARLAGADRGGQPPRQGVCRGAARMPPADAGPETTGGRGTLRLPPQAAGNPAKRPILAGAVEEVAGGPRELSVEFCGEAPVAAGAGRRCRRQPHRCGGRHLRRQPGHLDPARGPCPRPGGGGLGAGCVAAWLRHPELSRPGCEPVVAAVRVTRRRLRPMSNQPGERREQPQHAQADPADAGADGAHAGGAGHHDRNRDRRAAGR